MLWLREAAELPPDRVGPKALRLGRALALGISVPNGIVILPDEPLALPPIVAALGQLTVESGVPWASQRFAVRSSATAEDLAGHSAAGLFLSRTMVSPSDLAAAIGEVRASGHSDAVVRYCGGPVAVAVLIQPMVAANQLGVLHLSPDGSALCEERSAAAPEWANVIARALAADDRSPLAVGARRLAALLAAELGSTTSPPATGAAYIEYALLDPAPSVIFLQVRPAPLLPLPPAWSSEPIVDDAAVYIHDQEHNPDPLSLAQSGLVEGVADLVPNLRQRVIHGYLYYAEVAPARASLPPALAPAELAESYRRELLPACESLLCPLEQQLVSSDGALDPRLLSQPERCRLTLADAWTAYRGVYQRYVAQLGPALRRARQLLNQLLTQSIGQSQSDPQQALLLAGAAPTERLQQLWELGRAGAPEPLLRAYLARYGAFAPGWDIAVACDDERPQWLAAVALRLGQPTDRAVPSPRMQQQQSTDRYQQALASLKQRLPATAWQSLLQLLPAARAAQRIAEEDDALFFRAQRLLRWALLRRGAVLCRSGRLGQRDDIFDLPWTLQLAAPADPEPGSDDTWAANFAPGQDLDQLASAGASARRAAAALVPPSRLISGQPLWTPPRSDVLRGYGVSSGDCPMVRGQARVIRTLIPDSPLVELANQALPQGTILVLPVLLPSWAAAAWSARALVTDSGGALSHGAILARERGVPAVVGTGVATRTITDGQELWVDAERGLVYLIPPAT